ncbi:interferon-induced 35 kDa protein [Oryzias latipes]|uniref:Interferon-induced protein 35 n=1 Tax=Oryzias latipes TaxID=8090 RepID=A0A3B3HH24_ORYLA|nr:interferon-induced 35 kDa protein [Oryzias latipes]
MSSEEDFSLVDSQLSDDTLEGVQNLISNQKKIYDLLLEEQKDLIHSRDDRREMTKQFKRRTEKMTLDFQKDELSYRDQLTLEKAKVDQLKQEEGDLMRQIRQVQAAIKEEGVQNDYLREQADVIKAMPDKKLVFRGATAEADDWEMFEMRSEVIYPMEGGTALITFEEEDVAQNILDMKTHHVDLGGDCRITVESRAVELMLPSAAEINSSVCPNRILVSNLPKMDEEILKNKLEIHFSKSKHKGGEVDECEYLPDSGAVVVTFVEDNIAKGLTECEFHDVRMDKKTSHRVKVTPFLNGKITDLQTRMTTCPRTVLLTGIPHVMDRETLQDLLEIHFQKNGNGGGEIEAMLYNPLGQSTSAVFRSVSPDSQRE